MLMRSEKTILILDRGNTLTKVTVLSGKEVLDSRKFESLTVENLLSLFETHDISGGIYCSVGKHDVRLIESLRLLLKGELLVLTHTTPLPIEIEYSAPESLGLDRIAAAAGADMLMPDSAVLIVDAGTAMTTDLLVGGKFLGGNISPGLMLRFKSLHDFTSALPLVHADGELPVIGHDTVTAIRCGVVDGLVAEITALYRKLEPDYPGLKMMVTGGDAGHLIKILKENNMTPLHEPNLVALGLRNIFEYNTDE